MNEEKKRAIAESLSGEPPRAEPPNEEDAALVELVERFSAALLEKLRASEAKYGWSGGWRHDPNWADDLRRDIRKHIEKGDPRDVAAYCAFAWHHGWSLARSRPSAPEPPPAEPPTNTLTEDEAIAL